MTNIFYDQDLVEINYDSIIWGEGYGNFDNLAKNSQLIYFLKKFKINKKICIVHNCQFDADKISNSDIDFIIVNCSDHPYEPPFVPSIKNNLILGSNFNHLNYYPYHLLF